MGTKDHFTREKFYDKNETKEIIRTIEQDKPRRFPACSKDCIAIMNHLEKIKKLQDESERQQKMIIYLNAELIKFKYPELEREERKVNEDFFQI